GEAPRVSAAGMPARGRVTVSRAQWKRPSRARVRALRDRLRLVYGRPIAPPHRHGLDELILTVLSQSTNDRNRDVAFLRLRERFGSWAAGRDAPLEDGELAIQPGGLPALKVGGTPPTPARAGAPAAARPPPRPGRRARARRAAGVPGRGAQDGSLRPVVRLRHARRAGRHARLARRPPPRPVPR